VVVLGFSVGLGQKYTRRWRFCHRLGLNEVRFVLQTNQLEGKMGLKREPANSFGDIGGATSSEYRDDEISQCGHDTWRRPGSYLRAVFVKGLVAYPVEAVFNAPVHAIEFKDTLR
jgi:hypothetical protein